MSPRTAITFQYDEEIWPAVEKWAGGNGFKLKSSIGSERLYQKGKGFWQPPIMFRVNQIDQEVTFEAWVRLNLLYGYMRLYLLSAETSIESGGYRLFAPRRTARQAVNKLLQQLGQKVIP